MGLSIPFLQLIQIFIFSVLFPYGVCIACLAALWIKRTEVYFA